ncbi:COP9 signalosome complex subunit 6a [Triticum urartu]|uniref:COP9 signalosome complex subunit 6a n=1 Tax=Triticum urartu TaxID=4572 RepID=M7Z8B3_TRIUA|nr:COP9 signalosome complex subunit 6a [Triticum urartu]
MPSPDAATGEASTPLSTRVRAFKIHPNVVRNFLDHHIRVKDQAARCGGSSFSSKSKDAARMFGCVIGMKSGQTVEILDSLDLLLDPVSGTLCRALLEKKEHYEKFFPGSVVLGWYSSRTMAAEQDTDMQIHKALMDAEGRAFYIVLNPAIYLSQMDLCVTIYDCVLGATDGSPQLNLVKFDCTTEVGVLLKCLFSYRDVAQRPHQAFRTMLLETPSGFAMFSVSARLLKYPEVVYSSFWTSVGHFLFSALLQSAISTLGFIKVHDKSVARDSDVGPGKDLERFILKSTTTHALIVPDADLKFVIEKKLKVICWLDAHIVDELTWGLKYVLDKFLPEEKDSPCHLPLSKELEKKIKSYGFSVSPQVIDREFITTVGYLYELELTSESLSVFLHHKFDDCFYGRRLSDLEFAKAISDRLKSSEEMIPNYGEYSKQDIVRFTDYVLAAPGLKNDAILYLKKLERAARKYRLAVPDEQKKSMEFLRKAEARDKESKLVVNIEAAASKSKAVGKNKKDDDIDDSKPETRKRGVAGSVLKMPASNKKAKVATPSCQKTGDNKGAVHVAALHPAKNTGHTPPTSEKSHKFSSMEVLQQVKKEVIIERIFSKKCRFITLVKGLESFGINLSDASMKLRKKFATRASVFKGPTEKEQIAVKGDVSCDIVEFIRDTWSDSQPI